MKKLTSSSLFILGCFALGLVLMALTGCSSIRNAVLKPVIVTNEVPAIVVTNISFTTNITVIAASTNEATGEVTPPVIRTVVTPREEVIVTPAHQTLGTNWVKNEAVFTTVSTIGDAFPGIGQLIAGLFGATGTLLAAFWNRKSRGFQATAVANIQGIEEIRRALQLTPQGRELDKKFVEALERAQRDHNAMEITQKLIDQFTGYTTGIDLKKVFGQEITGVLSTTLEPRRAEPLPAVAS